MKKKKLKKQVKVLRHDVDALVKVVNMLHEDIAHHQGCCENYKPKTVTFKRFVTLPKIYSMHEGYTGEIPIPKMKEETYERKTSGESGGETD